MLDKKTQRRLKRASSAQGPANGHQLEYPREMTVKAIERKWPDQWVLIQVTRRRQGQTSAGLVLGFGRRRDYRRLAKIEIAWLREHPGVETFLFWTGELMPKGVYPIL